MKKYLLSFLFLFSAQQLLHAQVPGFRGKRLMLDYHLSLNPRLSYLGYSEDLSELGKHQPNVAHNVGFDYIVTRNISLGVSVKKYKTQTEFYFGGGVYENLHTFNMSAQWVTLRLKLFDFNRKGFIAPLGFYNCFEIGLGTAHLLNGKKINTTKVIDGSTMPVTKDPALGLFYSTGVQGSFWGRLLIHAAVQVGVVPAVVSINDILEETVVHIVWSNDQYYKMAVNNRMNNFMLMSVNVGIGLMIF